MSARMHPSSQPRRPAARPSRRPAAAVGYRGFRGPGLLRVGVTHAPGRCGTGVSHGGSVFQVERGTPTRGRPPDLRRHRRPLRRPLPRPARRLGSRRPRPRRRAGPVRPQDPQDPHHPHAPQLHHGGGPAPSLRRLRQRRRLRARRAGLPSHLGHQHPRLLRGRGHVLAGERAAGRATRLARHQPQPARVRRHRPPRVAGRLHGEPGQPGDGHRAQGQRQPGRPPRPLHGRRRGGAVRARPPRRTIG